MNIHHVNKTVILLCNYIYNKLEELTNLSARCPAFKNESLLYERFKVNNEYDIKINFNDIKDFNWYENQLLTYGLLNDEEYTCDFVVRLEKMEKDSFGYMDRGEPLLSINAKYFRTYNSFNKYRAVIRNTLMHELTHYLQYFGNVLKGGNHQKDTENYDADFYNELQNIESEKYSMMSFVIYSFSENERFARVAGIYGSIIEDYNKLIREYKRKYKHFPNKEEFVEFVLNNEKYNNNEIHIQHYTKFLNDLENDTYENYKKCINDPIHIYKDDSIIYVYLNMCDHIDPRPGFLLPKGNIFVYNTITEKEYNKVKNLIIKKFKKNFNKYVRNIKVVIEYIYNNEINNE